MNARLAVAKDILASLVAFDTTSAKTNIPMAEWVRDYLARHGIAATLIPAADGIHVSLFATLGDAGKPGIGLSGHMDVVPVTGQPWDTDPFRVVEHDGRLYGRGTADMKGFVACVLAMVPEFAARRLATPLHIVLSYNEEVGCIGVRDIITEFGRTLPKPSMVLVGEPTSMQVVDAHKGGYRFRTTITGKDAHTAKPQLGVNAIFVAGQLMAELQQLEARQKARHIDPRFDPPYSSVAVMLIEGGIATNIIPPNCSFFWGVRALPGFDGLTLGAEFDRFAQTEVLPAMRAVHPEASIVTELTSALPAFSTASDGRAASFALQIAGQNETFAVSYGTEASQFQLADIPSVIIGPGDISQAHRPNEFIEIAELDRCLAFLARVGDAAAAG